MEYTSIKLKNPSVSPNLTASIIEAPGSKSEAIRYIIGAFLCKETSIIKGVDLCDDVLRTIDAISSMGADVKLENDGFKNTLKVTGININKKREEVTINVGSSATLFRIIAPISLMIFDKVKVMANDDLLKRPMDTFKEYINIEIFNDHYILSKKCEKFITKCMKVDGSVSSQYASGVLFAQSLLNCETELEVTNLESKDYLNMTVECLKDFGFDINIIDNKYFIRKSNMFSGITKCINGDYSQAAFFLTLASLIGNVKIMNLNKTYQADEKIIDILKERDAQIERIENGYICKKSDIKWMDLDVSEQIDLSPIYFILGALALINGEKKVIIKGTRRLAYKESDRAKSLKDELIKVGIDVDIRENECELINKNINIDNIDIIFNSHNDHRICMALTIFGIMLNLKYSCNVLINDINCINKSFPSFFNELEKCNVKFIRL